MYIHIWVNYNISLYNLNSSAIWGWFLLLTMTPVRSQWGRYNLPRYMYNSYIYIISKLLELITIGLYHAISMSNPQHIHYISWLYIHSMANYRILIKKMIIYPDYIYIYPDYIESWLKKPILSEFMWQTLA